jgi:hypothetical protein
MPPGFAVFLHRFCERQFRYHRASPVREAAPPGTKGLLTAASIWCNAGEVNALTTSNVKLVAR